MRIKRNNFHINSFARSLALKQRLGGTWKWPTVCLLFERRQIEVKSK